MKLTNMKIIKFYAVLLKTAFLFAAGFLLISCGQKTIEMKKFVNVYCDLNIAQDTLKPPEFMKMKKEILNKYGITEKELKDTYQDYYNNPKQWQPFFEKALARMDEMKGVKKMKNEK